MRNLVINNESKLRELSENNATLILKSRIISSCATYDPIGLDSVDDCLVCENADYRIIDKDKNIIVDFKFPGLKQKDMEVEKYCIEFFDDVDYENVVPYLRDNYSDYRMTRISDGVVLRLSKDDVAELKEERARMFPRLYEKEVFDIGDKKEEKPISFIKRIQNRIKRANNS